MAEAEPATIARPYARAAFSYALDQAEGLQAWSKMLALLATASSEKIVTEALDDPLLSGDEEANLLIGLQTILRILKSTRSCQISNLATSPGCCPTLLLKAEKISKIS